MLEQTQDLTALLMKGVTFHQQGQLAQAKVFYEKVLARQPKHFDALHLSGVIASQCGQPALAIVLIKEAIEIEPDDAPACVNLGIALKALGNNDEAVTSYNRAISINPNYAEAYNNRGNALKDLERYEEAIQSYDKAIDIKPDYAEAHYNRGNAHKDLKRYEEAVQSYDKAIAIKSDYAGAHSNRGRALESLNRLNDAINSYDRAIAISPDNAKAYWNKSLTLLLLGHFQQGWKLYEMRWKTEEALASRFLNFAQPLWLGSEALTGKTILLHAEQGLGDTLQFCRYAQLVKNLGATVLLEVPQPLMDLLAGLSGVDVLIESGQALPAFDYHCPLMSLPLAFKTDLTNIPHPTAYLQSNASKLEAWSQRLGTRTKPLVGLVWSGSTEHKNDHNRSLPLAELLQHLPDTFEYVSLQKEVRQSDQAALAASKLLHFGDELKDFTDTAALCECVDVVVSVDTSVAHLAGAMGKPTCVLLPYVPDWRWLLDREDSPWYASVKLYRQEEDRLWSAVFARLARDLT